MPLHLEIVSPERVVLSDEVDQVNAPTKAGRVGILPHHMSLLTILEAGDLDIVKGGERTTFALSGGVMEVLANRVTILASTIERSDEIDEMRAERARERAEQRLRDQHDGFDRTRAEADLRRAMVRLKVAQLRKLRRR